MACSALAPPAARACQRGTRYAQLSKGEQKTVTSPFSHLHPLLLLFRSNAAQRREAGFGSGDAVCRHTCSRVLSNCSPGLSGTGFSRYQWKSSWKCCIVYKTVNCDRQKTAKLLPQTHCNCICPSKVLWETDYTSHVLPAHLARAQLDWAAHAQSPSQKLASTGNCLRSSNYCVNVRETKISADRLDYDWNKFLSLCWAGTHWESPRWAGIALMVQEEEGQPNHHQESRMEEIWMLWPGRAPQYFFHQILSVHSSTVVTVGLCPVSTQQWTQAWV